MSASMRALLYTESFALEVLAVPAPQPGPEEVVVRVEAAGICGSDLHGVASRSPRRAPPLIMGHELCGQVVAAGGPAVETFFGARVAVNPQVPCGECLACRSGQENVCARRQLVGGTRPGGFAEFVSVPVRCLHRVSPDLAADVAVFCEPLATCVHALRLVPDSFTEVAVVLGAGTIGVLAAQVLRVAGTRLIVVSEVDESRRRSAESVADAVVAPHEVYELVNELTGGSGVSLSIDAVGSDDTRRNSIRVLRAGGVALWLGMHEQGAAIPAFDLVVREQRVQGSFAYTNPEFGRALGLLESGLIVPAVSQKSFPLEESGEVFTGLLHGASDGFLKAIVKPG